MRIRTSTKKGIRATVDMADGRTCEYDVKVEGGVPTFTRLEVTGAAITARGLRTIPIGQHLAEVHAHLANEARKGRSAEEIEGLAVKIPASPGVPAQTKYKFPDFDDLDRMALAAAGGDHITEPRKQRGRPGKPDLFYARLAEAYVAAIASGSRRPTADVAEKFNYDEGRVRTALNTARERGILTRPPAPGRPGGMLTDRGRAILSAAEG